MSDARPPDDPDAHQAELELGDTPTAGDPGTNGASGPPADAPPEDPPPEFPQPEGEPPPETDNQLPVESVADDAANSNPDLPSSSDVLPDDDRPDQSEREQDEPLAETLDDGSNTELESLLDTVPEAGSSALPLPRSWPDPIPVGAPTRQPTWFDGIAITPPLVILGALVTISFLLFVAIEPTPRWLLLFVAVIAVLGTDGALRQAWPRPFSRSGDDADSTPYLFLPALAAIAWPMLIEHNVRGYWVLPAALLAGIGFTALLSAQVSSVRVASSIYPITRLASTAAVYFTAFALFSLSYILDVELPASVAAVAVVAAMLGVELFREGEVDPLETLVFSAVTGVILAEARWAMYYVPVGGYLAGLALLLGFFLVTGLLHSHLTRRLNRLVALEYGGIAAAGVLLVTIAAQAGLA